MINIAILGYGVVGSGVAQILRENQESIQKTTGKSIKVKYILTRSDPDPNTPNLEAFTKDFQTILNDPDVHIIVESMGGLDPAYPMTKEALRCGKSVVTPNKELVATHGAQLLAIAKENNCNYLFEASVGGGIPVLHPLTNCFTGNHITDIKGILNGTTNYILTKMIEEGLSFQTALKQAQDLGFAERNPSADVDGHDACRKICILGNLAFGTQIDPTAVSTEGITKITLEDVAYANVAHCSIKLLGRSFSQKEGEISIYVAPHLVPHTSPLHSVNDVFNAISITGDMVGETMFYGKGAGKLPTASAVVADVADLAKDLHSFRQNDWAESCPNVTINHGEQLKYRFYLRLKENTTIQSTFPDSTPLHYPEQPQGEQALITAPITEEECNSLCKNLEVIHKLRVLDPLESQ